MRYESSALQGRDGASENGLETDEMRNPLLCVWLGKQTRQESQGLGGVTGDVPTSITYVPEKKKAPLFGGQKKKALCVCVLLCQQNFASPRCPERQSERAEGCADRQ